MIFGDETEKEQDARHVFLLMGKEYRISRSIRAQWFFQQFHSTLPYPKPHDELISSNQELEILSVLPKDPADSGPYRLVPSTHITFIGRRYRFVFCLDISPSLATVDIQSGTVITDEAFGKFRNCLSGLVAPFSVPGSNIFLSPELYITVLAYTSVLNPKAPQVLIQGCLVSEHNVNTVLEMVHDQLKGLEDFLAKTTSAFHGETSMAESDQGGLPSHSVTLMSPEAGPISILRNALLALQLLPDNASAGAVVITDGVFALPDASAVDSLLAQLRASTVCCSFIKVGSGFHAHCSLGYVPHCDMMQFIAMATSGAYLAKAPPVHKEGKGKDGDDLAMNLYHKALLCWNIQRDFDLSKIDPWIGDCLQLDEEDLTWPLRGKRSLSYALSEWEQNAMQPSMRKRHLETKLHTSITSVLSVRLREGYSIQDVSITKGGKQLQVRLTIPWKHNVQIEYLALAAWPLSHTNCTTHVEVTIEAPYEFLHDVMYPMKKPFTSGYRTLVVKRFRQAIKSLQSTDELLTHLQSFSSNSSYYTIPESAKNGVPLFYLAPNSSSPVLSLQHVRKSSKSQESQFAVFWKPVLSMDATTWQRWMHCHRIGLVLEHDVPLPKNLHLPAENDRFSAIQCRVALSSLNSLFIDWSSFVLLENHSYIKFIKSKSPEDAPTSFCIARIIVRGSCIVIKVAFLGGTEGYIRHEIVSDIRSQLSQITAPLGQIQKPSKPPAKGKNLQRVAQLSSQRIAIEKPCAILYDKPLERMLVRYERIPADLLSPYPEVPHYSVYDSLTGVYAHRTNENHMKVLCQYLHHHRWIWTMQDEGTPAVSGDDVARILSTLTKLRLQEGFNFVNNSAGIITMAKELKMKDNTKDCSQLYSCVIQYVLFPPYHRPSETERAEEAVADWAYEGKPPLAQRGRTYNMVTEIWAEPQFGLLTDLSPELKYLEGLKYNEAPEAIYQMDVKHVSALLTYDHLFRMCDDQTVSTPHKPLRSATSGNLPIEENWVVEQLPFPFDVIGLLPKTRQVEMVFSSLIETSTQGSADHGESPNENLFKLLLENMERLNDREITLTEGDWQRFLQHVQGRERNGIPLPFPEDICPDEDSNARKCKVGKPLVKWRCFIRGVTGLGCDRLILTFLPSSLKYVRLMGRRGRRRSSSATSSPRSVHHTQEKEETLLNGPAVFSHGSSEDRGDTPTPTVEKDEGALGFNQETTDSVQFDDTGSQKLNGAELRKSHDDDKRSVTFKENTTPTEQNPPFRDPCVNDVSDYYSFDIPIYCYDCPMSALITVREHNVPNTTPEEAKKREDIFQDFTQSAAQIFMDPFSLDEVPRSLEGQTRGRFGASKDLLLHCNAVHDLFFRSFVSSTFTSLQRGQQVTMRDVHSAVDTCEENFFEVDITEFIRTLCGHCSRKDKIQKNPQSVSVCPGSNYTEENMMKLRQCFATGCESVPGLHKSIAAKFMSILQRYFKAVPPSGEFFFYCPQQQSEGTRKSVPESFSDLVENYTEQTAEDDTKDAGSDAGSDVFDDMDVDAGILIGGPDGPHPQYDMDLSEFESEGSELDYEDAATEDDEPSKSPLFLQLTCSLRDRSSHGQAMTPVSIHTLPICLGEIIQKVEDDEECLDPFRSSVRITLDLICLTLSQEPDYTVLKSSARNAPSRSNSFSSTSSPVSLSPQDKRSVFDFRRQDSKATSHDTEGMGNLDPLHGLVFPQRQALNITCDAVRWLLQDEIVSELRHNGPVNKLMLEKVENHVKQSEDHVSCISRTIPLQFVFGAEQSMELFVKEIEKFSLPEFLLNKVDEYYYLSRYYNMEKEVLSLTPIDEAASVVSLSNLEAGGATVENVGKGDQQERAKWVKTREGPTEVTVNTETGEEEKTLSSEGGNITNQDEAEEGRNMDESSSDVQMDLQPQASEEFDLTEHIPTISEPLKVEDTEGEELSLPRTPCSNRQSLAHIGKQQCTEDELSVQAEVTPVGVTFTSSPESTPVCSLFALGVDLNKANSSSGIAEEEESPRTPRQDDAWVEEATDQFWLVMRIFDNHVDIFFHQREPDGPSSFCATRANGLVETVTNAIHEKCRIVNQRMLLHELYETKICNSMLFPESDEDIWKHEDLRMSVSPLGVYMSKGDSSGRVTSKYVQVQYLFQPGHFGCESVFHTHLPVHQRLRDSSGRPGISRGLKAIKSVLDRFGVSNRKDMFVYKESSGAVFYFRLFESLCEYETSHQCPLELRPQDVDEDDRSGASSLASLAGSRTPSQWSLLRGDTVELFEDVFESKLKKNQTLSERDAVSVQSFQPVIEESIALHVYGVDEPGPEITVDLVEVLQNRINEAMLEVLSVLISRNPNCKLTYADVRFIQPQGQPPKATLTFIIPPMDVNFLCPLSFYLRQNLLQFLHSPRYADTNTGHHFKSVNSSKASPTGSNSGDCCRLEPEVYLYNRPHSSGGKGLACICASVLNSNGGYIHIPCGKTACMDVEVSELDYFEQMTEVFPYSDEYRSEDDLLVQFAVWERGDIALDQLSGHLKLALRHALCDLLIEYYLLTAPLSIVPARYRGTLLRRALPVSEPVTPTSLTPKGSKAGLFPESAEKTSKRQLEFSAQSGFRGRAASLAGHKRSPSNASLHSTPSSSLTGVTVRNQQNPFIVSRPSNNSENSVSRQSTLEDEVFKAEAMALDTVSTAEDALEASMTAARTEQEPGVASQPNPDVQEDGAILRDLKPCALLEVLKASGESEKSIDLDPTFELFTDAEIQESQEFASLPGTPVSALSENTAFALKKNETPSQRDNVRHLSPGGVQSSQTSSLNGALSGSGEQSPAVQPTWQEMEVKRRNNQEQKRRKIQYENGEVGELHPSLQGLAQDMFTFFRQLGLLSVHSIEGKLINNFATDAFLNELVNLISLLCSDVKPKVYREAPYNSIDRRDIDDRPELNCLHYYPARQPLKVQDLDESSADKSGKLFAPTPDSSHFFVVVGRNVDQWRASLGREEDFTYDDSSGRPRIRPGLQRFKPLDPNAPVPGGRLPDSNSVTNLSAGGVPRQKFILVTVMDKDVIVFTYNWAVDLNNALDKQLNRLLHWNNARCHITSCLLSQKLGLFHHTLFADINNDKEGKEVNPFCFSTNDNDMVLLISRPAPPPPDRERAMPRQMLASPSILVFDEVLRDVTPPRALHRTQYFLNRDPVKRHGYQFQEIRSVQIKTAILQQNLDELYRIWQQRPPHVQISEDKIEALKRSSRLIHYCAAPLLFHPRWRDKRAATELEKIVQEQTRAEGPEKREKSKERKTSREDRNDTKKERTASPVEGSSTREDAWHVELRSAYVQQYVQYMQSLQFIMVQTRPQSPRQSRRYLARSGLNVRAKRESSPLESKKQGSSKDNKESQSKMLHCYLQRSSPGGIMLTELMFQGCFFIVRLYALECSQIPSGKTASVQMCRLFLEDCTRYREFIHLLSFNYDFHLCKAQMYLNGSQRIFNKGYGVTRMLRGLLQEYPECPVYARNRLCTGEIAVPCAPTSAPRVVFSYMVKNASKYDFSTLSLETSNSKKSEHALLGSERVLKQIRGSETKTYDILRDNNEYDISLVVSLKDTLEQGVVILEYLVVMTSRRELFPKLSLDLKLRKRSPSSCSLSSMAGGRKTSLPENGSIQEQEKGARVRFVIPSSSSSSQFSTNALQSSGEFHRSASSPHSLCAMGSDTGLYMNLSPSLSDENIKEIRRDSLPVFSTLPSDQEDSSSDKVSLREARLLREAFIRAHNHLIHVVCRAQTHCNRDLLWHRLFAGGSGEEEKEATKKGRRKSEYKKPGQDSTASWNWKVGFDTVDLENDQSPPARLSFDEFKQLLSSVVCNSLKDEDPQLIPVLSMNPAWYLNLFRVMIAKFPDKHRLYVSEGTGVHYLAILNLSNSEMFVLLYVDEATQTTDIMTVFRDDKPTDGSSTRGRHDLHSKSARSHVYSVVNAVCFHLWTSLLPT